MIQKILNDSKQNLLGVVENLGPLGGQAEIAFCYELYIFEFLGAVDNWWCHWGVEGKGEAIGAAEIARGIFRKGHFRLCNVHRGN